MDAINTWIEQTHPAYLLFIGITFAVAGTGFVWIVGTALRGWLWGAPDLTHDEHDTCTDCGAVLDDDNRAITCPDHPLCTSCDGHHNPCSECAYWKAYSDNRLVDQLRPDPLLDYERASRDDPFRPGGAA